MNSVSFGLPRSESLRFNFLIVLSQLKVQLVEPVGGAVDKDLASRLRYSCRMSCILKNNDIAGLWAAESREAWQDSGRCGRFAFFSLPSPGQGFLHFAFLLLPLIQWFTGLRPRVIFKLTFCKNVFMIVKD